MRPSVVRQPHEEDRHIAEGSLFAWERTVVGTSVGGPTLSQQDRSVALRCETCGATFTTGDALQTHLRDAYHGFQCLHCGALFARRGQMNAHECQDHPAWRCAHDRPLSSSGCSGSRVSATAMAARRAGTAVPLSSTAAAPTGVPHVHPPARRTSAPRRDSPRAPTHRAILPAPDSARVHDWVARRLLRLRGPGIHRRHRLALARPALHPRRGR